MKLNQIHFLMAHASKSKDDFVYQELEMSSDYVDILEDTSNTEDCVDLHSHTFFELLFCRSGSLQYMLGNTRYQLKKNSIVCIPPGVSHRPLYLEQLTEPYRRMVIWMNHTLYESSLEILQADSTTDTQGLLSSNVFLLSGATLYQVEEIYEKMMQIPENFSGAELYKIGLATQLLSLFHQYLNSHEINPLTPEKAILSDEIIQFIDEHLAENLSIQSIASHFLISESSVSQLFKKQMKLSLYRYITQRRLIESKNLICRGATLKKLPELCGFSDYSTFYKAFVKQYGISPKEYKTRLFATLENPDE